MYIEKLSLYIITLNEERRLPKVLEAAKDLVDEIVVVDSGSVDRTEEIARAAGARFLYHQWESVGQQVRWAEDQCSYDWVLRLDADEVLSPGLAAEIRRVRETGDKDGYYIKSGEMFPGMKRPNPWVWHYNLIRLYNRNAFRMSGRIGFDDVVRVSDAPTTGQLKNFIHHYSYLTLQRTIEKRNRATDLQVERALAEGKNYSPWRMVGTMSLNFFKYFFLHRFFLLGWWGFMHSINIGYMRFQKFAKFYELKQLEKYRYPD